MPPTPWTCPNCLLHLRRLPHRPSPSRAFSTAPRRPAPGSKVAQAEKDDRSERHGMEKEKEESAMSRRLSDMMDSSLASGGRSAARTVEAAGFGAELKAEIEERIKTGGLGKGKMERDFTAGEPFPRTTLRMLDDSTPLPRPTKDPSKPKPTPKLIAASNARAQRLAAALDNSSLYTVAQASQISASERAQFRSELAERFSAPARALPSTPQGLTNLANERIEAAMAAGSFANLPRGREAKVLLGKDGRGAAGAVYVDTTEFVLNRLIKRQDVVPAWIEKQRELMKGVEVWRGRLRNEWKRRVVRAAGMGGGGVEEMVDRAKAWAEAERIIRARDLKRDATGETGRTEATQVAIPSPAAHVEPFRDPVWLRAEGSFHTASLAHLNSLTRSYNLLAPVPAQKPYLSLERELRRCYADVAPLVVEEILARDRDAAKRKKGSEMGMSDDEGVARSGSWPSADRGRKYGLKEFWRDFRSRWSGNRVK